MRSISGGPAAQDVPGTVVAILFPGHQAHALSATHLGFTPRALVWRRQADPASSTLDKLPCIAATDPFVPVVKVRRLWARLSTHVPTEPAVTGGEHTAVGFSAAGMLLWLSPWQVCMVQATGTDVGFPVLHRGSCTTLRSFTLYCSLT